MSKNVLLISSLILTLLLILSAAGGVGAAKSNPHASAVVESQATLAPPGGGKWIRKPARPGGRADEAGFIAGEVLVKFKDRARAEAVARSRKNGSGVLALSNDRALDAILRQHGVTGARQPFSRAKSEALRRIVKLTSQSLKHDPRGTKVLVEALSQDPGVEYAEPNYLMRTQWTPNDPYFTSTGAWGQSFRDLWGLEKIGAEAAWDLTRGANVVVAIIDTGVDYGHEDIAANVWENAGESGTDGTGRDRRSNGLDDDGNGYVDDWRGWDFVTSDGSPSDNDPQDDHGHGTHVAGTVAAVGDNQLGIVGVAPESKVMALKGISAADRGSVADLSEAIVYASDNGAKVINASWGIFSSTPIRTLIDAVAYAHQKDVVFVAAASNSASDVGTAASGHTPANIEDAVTVSAFNHADALASFSNYGSKIDVAAPGGGDTDASGSVTDPAHSILSLASSAGAQVNGSPLLIGTRYLRLAGTSMAAPHVAGVAALVRSLHPEFSAEQVRQALRAGSDDTGAAGFDKQSGYGRLNAAKALGVNLPLAAHLTGPTETLTGVEQVEVRGTVAGVGLADWRLEYRPAKSAAGWTPIHSSSVAVSNSTLATWDIAAVGDGHFELRLVAMNADGQTFEDRMQVRINNVFITDPPSDTAAIYRPDPALPIKGTVAPSNLLSYTFSVQTTNGSSLENARITLAGGGTQKVQDGLLATWDTTDVPAGSYSITLRVALANNASIERIVTVIIAPSLHEGSPKQLPLISEGGLYYSFPDHLVAADINGDGGHDLIVGYGDSVGVYDHAGRMLPGWPQTIDPDGKGMLVQRSPAVGDLDGDGSPEIASAAGHYLFVWRSDGTPLPGWPKPIGAYAGNYMSIADLNGDGANEIIMTSGILQVVDRYGAVLPGWPADTSATEISPSFMDFVVCDLDADGKKEIVARADSNGDGTATDLYVFGAGGELKAGWPQRVDNLTVWYASAHPAAGDLDGDGDLEIVVPAEDGRMHAYHHDGTVVAGWPQQTKGVAVNSPAVGDLDGDGRAEVVAGNATVGLFNGIQSNYLYAWRGDGTLLPGWPVKKQGIIDSTYYGFSAPVLADVDGDGAIDIVASGDYTTAREVLFAYQLDGSHVAGFPKHAPNNGAHPTTSPAVADFDGDGLLELAWVDLENTLYVWDLTAERTAPAPWPMYRHDAALTGASLRAAPPVVPALKFTTTLATSPAGLSVTLDGETRVAPVSVEGVADTPHTLGVVTPQTLDGVTYDFVSWSDGGAASHDIKTPGADTTYTANFTARSSLQLSSSAYGAVEGKGSLQFTVTRTGGSAGSVSISYATKDGTALNGPDYAGATGTVTFADGDMTAKTITIPVNDDALDENDETLVVTLSAVTGGATLGPQSTAVLTISDDDAAPSLSMDDTVITEAAIGAFTVRLSQASSQIVKVDYATANGTAISGQDYTRKFGTLTFNPGDLTKTFSVATLSDTKDESNETFSVNLTNSVNASVSVAQGTGTITDDDSAPSVSVADLTVTEANAGTLNAIFTIKLSGASGQSISVNYATENETAQAGIDYQSASGTLTFDAGQTTKTVTVPIVGDTTDEPTETFLLSLSSPLNVSISDASATCTVHDNDLKLSVNSVLVGEADTGANTTGIFTIKLSFASTKTVTVKYSTANVNAVAGSDYTALPLTTLTFAPGESTKTVPVQVTGDALDEVNETFRLVLSSPTNAAISASIGTATINDNDLPPTISVSSPTVTEGNAAMPVSFTVMLSAPSGQVVTVKHQTADGTAKTPTDYAAKALTTLTFLPGETTKTVSVSVAGDLLDEPAEDFKLVLSAPTNSTIAVGAGTCTITDNDLPPSMTISNVTVAEPDTGVAMTTFTVKLSAVSGQNVSVNYVTANGTSSPATADTDYTAVPENTLTFLPGETIKRVVVQVKGDLVKEANETFFVNLSGALNATIADPQGLGTILNDD
ncbi:MAG TPA: Calx-beta domain-containing protein [Pyrinomonadaceae bacterium]|jgi:subtilisin family serine protease